MISYSYLLDKKSRNIPYAESQPLFMRFLKSNLCCISPLKSPDVSLYGCPGIKKTLAHLILRKSFVLLLPPFLQFFLFPRHNRQHQLPIPLWMQVCYHPPFHLPLLKPMGPVLRCRICYHFSRKNVFWALGKLCVLTM